ncbi:MAG: nitroreductase family protein [Tenericutes bacterium]|nr:nitroreductase family protein [Mycoplasmatota bacterium]
MKDITLPNPELNFDFPLMRALEQRRTKRKWLDETLSFQTISNLLWAGCGETLKKTKRSKNRRTIPSGCNVQSVSLFVALDSGVYRYIESEHKLRFINDQDVRNNLGTQQMMKSAPFGLIYVGDFSKKIGIIKTDDNQKMFLAATESGAISQNIYLYCTAAGLNTVMIGLVDRELLRELIDLSENQIIVYTQIVGKSIN